MDGTDLSEKTLIHYTVIHLIMVHLLDEIPRYYTLMDSI